MRRISLAVALLATMLTVTLAASAAQPERRAAVKATLRIESSAPLTLRGSGFQRGELVRISVTTGYGHFVRQRRANAVGAFAVTFAGVTFDPCETAPAITATGTKSGRVVVRRVLPRDCAAP